MTTLIAVPRCVARELPGDDAARDEALLPIPNCFSRKLILAPLLLVTLPAFEGTVEPAGRPPVADGSELNVETRSVNPLCRCSMAAG